MYAILTTDSFTAMFHLSPLVQHGAQRPQKPCITTKLETLKVKGLMFRVIRCNFINYTEKCAFMLSFKGYHYNINDCVFATSILGNLKAMDLILRVILCKK